MGWKQGSGVARLVAMMVEVVEVVVQILRDTVGWWGGWRRGRGRGFCDDIAGGVG